MAAELPERTMNSYHSIGEVRGGLEKPCSHDHIAAGRTILCFWGQCFDRNPSPYTGLIISFAEKGG